MRPQSCRALQLTLGFGVGFFLAVGLGLGVGFFVGYRCTRHEFR